MGACDFSAVFSEICGSIVAGDSVSQVEIYSLLFDNYYLSHKDEAPYWTRATSTSASKAR